METILLLWEQREAIISGVTMIVAGASILAAMTPTPKDDTILAKAKKALDVLAFNIGNAKNRK